jgi:arsenate reductase
LLDEKAITYRYREYTEDPLTADEIRQVLVRLGLSAREVLRKADAANRALGLTGEEGDDALIGHIAAHPTLLQRPIGLLGARAVVGRPVERLLTLVAQ